MKNTTINGVEILGITGVSRLAVRPAPVAAKPVTRPTTATKPAPTAAKPASTTKPATKAAPAAKVKAAKAHAAKASSHAIATGNKLTKLHPGMSKMLKAAGTKLQSKATKIKGDVLGDDVEDVETASPTVERMAAAGDLATQILPFIDQLYKAGQTDLAHEGEMIVNSANYMIVDLTQQLQASTGGGSM